MNIHSAFRAPRRFGLALLGFLGCAACAVADIIPIIERSSEWKYLDTGVAPGATWKSALAFNDGAWKTGNGVFGYGDNISYGSQIAATRPNQTAKIVTHYFRKKIRVPEGVNLNTFSTFEIGVVRDDAVAVYVNGTELKVKDSFGDPIRDNLPSEGALTNTTTAIYPMEGDSEITVVTFYGATNLLQASAENLIAVELHQSGTTTTDARFDLYMNLLDAEPCYGDARPGIKATFDAVGQPRFSPPNTFIHQREPLEEPGPPDYSFDAQDTEINWVTTNPGSSLSFQVVNVDVVTGKVLPGNALAFSNGSNMQWQSEAIDVRDFKDLSISAKAMALRRVANPPAWTASERMEFFVSYSFDGVSYTEVPWKTITATGTSGGTEWVDLVGENAAKKAIVPTNATTPPSTGAGNWRTVAFNDSSWATGTKGAGYENNPNDAINYTGLIDANFDFKSTLYNQQKAVYMRASFPAVPRTEFPAASYSLRLRVSYDDGFVAYINDQEVARKNATGTPAFNSRATVGNADDKAVNFEDFNITTHLSKISQTEPNVLTIVGLNDATTSSDMLIWPVLQLGQPGGTPPVTFTTITANLSDDTPITQNLYVPIDSGALIPNGVKSLKLRMRGTVSGQEKAVYVDDLIVRGTPTTGNSFDDYMLQVAPFPEFSDAQRAARADLDGDSIPNIAEYAFGTDPAVAGLTTVVNGETRPILPQVYVENEYIFMKFRLPGGIITGDQDSGYNVLDLNIRPQIDREKPEELEFTDGYLSISQFQQMGSLEENNDGTVTVTVRTRDKVMQAKPLNVLVRVRIGVNYPSYLKGLDSICTGF